MIVDNLLEDFTWGQSGLSTSDPQKAFTMFQFIRQLIMDSHLYVTKIIGFSVTNRTMRSHTGTYIARNVQLGESYAEMMVKLSDKLIINTNENELVFDVKKGVIKASELPMKDNSKILFVKDDMCRVITGTCVLNFRLQTDCGYRDMQQNSNELPSQYFPMNTYFNIMDYVRVLPMMYGSTEIKLRLCNGMSMDILKMMIARYKGLLESQYVSEEELQWAQSFVV